jgi:hypothetical protein
MDAKRTPAGALTTPTAMPPTAMPPTAMPEARPTLAGRDRVIGQLGDAFANDRLDVDEFERRVTIAHQSDSGREVEALVADLPVLAPATPAAGAAARDLVPSRDVKPKAMVFTAMGGVERRGSWTVPRRLTVMTIMGGATLDFREARLPEGDVEIRISTLMGGVEIIVPPTLAVESNGVAIMGGFAHVDRAPTATEPGSTVLHVTGIALMGGVSIEMRLPGESGRQARRRRHRERRDDRRR